MKINGINRKFKLTIGAVAEISAICPNGDIDRMGELFEAKDIGLMLKATAQIAVAMNRYTGTEDPLTIDEVLSLGMEEFATLQNEILAAYKVDSTPQINAKSKKKDAAPN